MTQRTPMPTEQPFSLCLCDRAARTKRYGPARAVTDVSFDVRKGEMLDFLGANGAGKPTTMRVITGYLSPSEGNVNVAGFNVVDDPLEVKKRIGYLPELPPVYP